MKKNCLLILGTFIATSIVAQVNTNALPEIPDPASSTETPAAAVDTAAPAAPEAAATPVAHKAPVKKAAPKKKRVVKKIDEPTVNLTSGPAVVTVNHLIVRGQAGFHGEHIEELNKGETVNVISQINLDKHAPNEPAQWAKIALPSGVKVWISSHFVDKVTKTVTAHRLNLRAGPGENYSVVGTIDRGATISEIGTRGNWIQIQAPADSFAFVAAMYLDQTAIASAQPTTTPTPAPEPTPAPTPVTPAPAIQPATAPTTVAETQPTTTSTAGNDNTVATLTPTPDANATTMGMAPETEQVAVNTNPPPPRVATHEGYVRHSVSPIAPTAYELYDPATGNAINYLYSSSTNLDLSRYEAMRIVATGEEGMAARWGATPVLTIQRLYVVSTNPPYAYDKIHSPRASQKNIPGTKREKQHN